MHFSKIYIQDNFVPNVVEDQFRRKVIGIEVTLNEGEHLDDAKQAAEDYIKEYIQGNKIDSPHIVERYIPEEQLPTINVSKPLESMSFEEQIRSCKDIKILESYKLLVKRTEHLQSVYDKRLFELRRDNTKY